MFKFSDYIYIETFRFERNVYVLNFINSRLRKEGDLVDVGEDKRLDFVCSEKESVGADKN